MASKYGFIDVLDAALAQKFRYDYEINWDKTKHAVEVSFLLEAENNEGISLTDADGTESSENIVYEDSVLFYNPTKTEFSEEEYLVSIPYDEKGLSKEFLNYFAKFLQETADAGLDDLMDFLESDEEEFSIVWDEERFDEGDEALIETDFYKYPRY